MHVHDNTWYMYIHMYSVYLSWCDRSLVGLSYLKPCVVSQLPMAPIACPPLHLKGGGGKKVPCASVSSSQPFCAFLHQKSSSSQPFCAFLHQKSLNPLRHCPRSQSAYCTHTSLGGTKFMELFSFSFFRHQPPGPSEFFFWDPVRVLA